MPSASPSGPSHSRGPVPDRLPATRTPRGSVAGRRADRAPVGSSAVVYCEANFAESDGKTANGLVRYSERYEILSVIDSLKAGLDAGEVLDGEPNGIPICTDLATAIDLAGRVPDYFIFGMAPSSGMPSSYSGGILLF